MKRNIMYKEKYSIVTGRLIAAIIVTKLPSSSYDGDNGWLITLPFDWHGVLADREASVTWSCR